MDLLQPPPVVPGDLVAVVAPSSPFPHEAFARGLAWLRERYRVQVSAGIFERDGYLAGDDARRAAELGAAMTDAGVRAIVAARGGYGATRILDALPWDAFVRSPKWLVGFSDVTAFHATLWARGVASIHGPHVTGLGKDDGASLRSAWTTALERPSSARRWDGLRVVHAGSATGLIVGGNLALLDAMAAARRLVIPEGAILAIEDVTERPYRIDRMLTSLRLGGYLDRIAGLVFGELAQCDAGPDGRTVDEVIHDRTRDLGVPVLSGAPFGHGVANDAFVLGSRTRIEGSAVAFFGALAEGLS